MAPAEARPDFTPQRLHRLVQIEKRHFWFRGRRVLVRRLLGRFAGAPLRILDLGSGGGYFAQTLAGRHRVTALDFLPGGLRRLRRDSPAVMGIQSSAEQLPVGGGCFDAALALDVLEHIDDQAAARELHRILRPGGVLIVTVPAFPWLWSYRDTAAGHKRRYRRSALAALLGEAGFTIEALGYYQCLLFPLAIATRWFGKASPATRDLEDAPPGPVNALFAWVNRLEAAAAQHVPWPWGSSIYAVARRTA
jgi:SAM-dependent methyltransferase